MKVNREIDVLVYSGKSVSLSETLETLSSKDSKAVANFLVEKTSLPRELRTNALRLVLNEYVKIAKELVLSDEFMYRLNWYQKFSEYQLVNFWNVLSTHNADKFNEEAEVLKYKKTFYLLLILNADTVGFSDKELEELLSLKTSESSEESFKEFMSESDNAFYDYEYNFDGMSYEDFKTNLKRCATVADIRNIAEKYDIKVPKRLKKEELVALVAEGLRRQRKYDETTEEKLKKMSAITLQRFAKVNGINASTEMKKADVVDYVMNHIEASSKAVRKPRVQLVSIPEIEEFKFSHDYLREVNVVDDEDDDVVPASIPLVEEPVVEETPVVEPAPLVEEPVVEETPVVEPAPVVEEPVVEETPVVEPAPVVEESVVEETPIAEETEIVTETPVVEEQEEVVFEEAPVSPYNDELLLTIVRLLEEREQRDVVNEVLADDRFNNIVKLYEERIAFLEKIIQEVQTTPVPVNIQLSYPEMQAPVEVVINEVPAVDELAAAEDTPAVEETKVTEETPVIEESVTPITLDSTFDSLDSTEKKAVVKAEMKNADKVTASDIDADLLTDPKKTKRGSKKLKKLEKKRAKIQKIRDKNDIRIYKKHNRKRFKKFIVTLFLLALLLFIAVVTVGALIDFNVIPADVAAKIDQYLAYIPPFGPNGVIRTFVETTINNIKNTLGGLVK